MNLEISTLICWFLQLNHLCFSLMHFALMKNKDVSGMESLNSLCVKKSFRTFSVHQQNRSVKESNNFENKGFVFTTK